MSNLPRGLSDIHAAPREGGKSAEYELAEQDQQHRDGERAGRDAVRPDQRRPRGNPPIEVEDFDRGREKLDRVITK